MDFLVTQRSENICSMTASVLLMHEYLFMPFLGNPIGCRYNRILGEKQYQAKIFPVKRTKNLNMDAKLILFTIKLKTGRSRFWLSECVQGNTIRGKWYPPNSQLTAVLTPSVNLLPAWSCHTWTVEKHSHSHLGLWPHVSVLTTCMISTGERLSQIFIHSVLLKLLLISGRNAPDSFTSSLKCYL